MKTSAELRESIQGNVYVILLYFEIFVKLIEISSAQESISCNAGKNTIVFVNMCCLVRKYRWQRRFFAAPRKCYKCYKGKFLLHHENICWAEENFCCTMKLFAEQRKFLLHHENIGCAEENFCCTMKIFAELRKISAEPWIYWLNKGKFRLQHEK